MTDDFSFRIRRIVQWTIFTLAFAVMGWGFTPYPTWFAGLALGCFLALLSAIYTAWKINNVGKMAIRTEGKQKRASLGTLTRFSVAVLATVIVLRYPEQFHIAGMVIGLMMPSIIAWGDALYINMLQKKAGKG